MKMTVIKSLIEWLSSYTSESSAGKVAYGFVTCSVAPTKIDGTRSTLNGIVFDSLDSNYHHGTLNKHYPPHAVIPVTLSLFGTLEKISVSKTLHFLT